MTATSSIPRQIRQVQLRSRPVGTPSADNAEVVEVPLREPAEGELLVRNAYMSVEPYMRGRMSDRASYVEPFALGEPMTGLAVGRVIASRRAGVAEGDVVVHEQGWRDVALLAPGEGQALGEPEFALPTYLGALGIPGMTAWVGLRHIAGVRPEETVFISSAAGAVGSIAGQIAAASGCTVIGSCGSGDKVRRAVDDFGYDTAFDYHAGPVRDLLTAALAEVGRPSLDVYYDNVGGEHLEAAIRACGLHARIALCGAISTYDATEPVPGPRNLLLLIWRRIRMEGFLLGDHEHRTAEFREVMGDWLRSGAVRDTHTVVGEGIEGAFDGFMAMLAGGTVGKAVVAL